MQKIINAADVVKMYQEGLPSTDIAKYYDTVPTTIIRILRRSGVEIRRKGWRSESKKKWSKDRIQDAIDLYAKLKSLQKVGEHYGVSRQRIHQLIKQETDPLSIVRRERGWR